MKFLSWSPLSEADESNFRERLCNAAERVFAKQGPRALTMRRLALEIGMSTMATYRYFDDKDAVLSALRTRSFARLSDALESARRHAIGLGQSTSDAVGDAYRAFANDHPDDFRLMFDPYQPNPQKYPDLVAEHARLRMVMTEQATDLVDGMSEDEIGAVLWATAHGAVGLQFAGLSPGDAPLDLRRRLNRAPIATPDARGLPQRMAPAGSGGT